MKRTFISAATLTASLALALAAPLALAAESVKDTPTYLLANLYVEDFEAYGNDYANQLGPLLSKAGAEVLVVAPQVTKLEGDNGANLTIVVRFPSLEIAEDYFQSEDYAALRPARIAATDASVSTLVLAPEFGVQAE